MKPEHLSTPRAIVSAPWLGLDGYCMATCCTAMELLLPHDLLHAHLNANAPEGGESRALHFGCSGWLIYIFSK
ncbi:GD17796 [Drosophila simulans]|uniref:GD17796 n=1 Tax=Drosophila simulans TaxID=7240 RepID=B4QZI6_DROSI|nr:GD17796 [Drosophila simulans]